MRSRVEWRPTLEWALRAAALALLAWALVASATGRRPSGATMLRATLDTTATQSAEQLRQWTRRADLAGLHLSLGRAPDRRTRDWLRALDGAGTAVSWEGEVPALGVAVEPLADPRGGVQVAIAAPAGATVHVADDAGPIDSLVAARGGGSLTLPMLVGGVSARTGVHGASASLPAGRALRRAVVLARAGWEGKFVAAALEERGWAVATRLSVAPGLAVGGGLPALDTALVSVVVALDSTAAGLAPAIARYVRAGGGLILGAEAARTPAFATLLAGRAGEPVRAAPSYAAAIAPVTRETLGRAPLSALRPDAVALERGRDGILLAARRIDAGRVLQLGYEETWRWRMAGGDDAPDEHRRWWAELASAVAHAPVDTAARAATDDASPATDPAPRAAMVAALGAPSLASDQAAGGAPFDPSRSVWIYVAVALLLCGEWALRRVRGAK